MGFFDKIKQGLGIGGVKVELLDVDTNQKLEDKTVNGKVKMTSKSDLHVLDITVSMKQIITTGRGQDKERKEKTIGELKMRDAFDIKAGEEKIVDFSLPYEPHTTASEGLKKQGGVLGGIGKLGAMASNEQVTYKVEADVDVKGVALDPSDSQEVNLV